MRRLTVLLVALPFLGCGSEGNSGLFGVGTQGTAASGSASTSGGGSTGDVMTTSISAGNAEGGGGNDNSSTPDPSTDSSGDETSTPTTGLEPTSGATTTDDGGSTSTGSSEEESSSSSSSSAADDMGDDGGMMGGVQPDDGMYSPCTVPRDCGFAPELCITLSDMDGTVLDGFCSETTCNNPAIDCDPSPGGTAPTACLDVTVDGMADTACVLDCTGGATCPTGMTCYDLGAISICG